MQAPTLTRRTQGDLNKAPILDVMCQGNGSMVRIYMLVCLFDIISRLGIRGYEGFYYRDAAGVDRYGLEALGMDILEKIKRASGHPISSDIFSNIPQSGGYGTLTPYKKYRRKGKNGLKYLGKNKRYSESENSGKSGKEKWGDSYDESSGSKNEFMSEKEFTDDHYHEEEGDEEDMFKGMRKRHRAFLSKGFEDVYHRDETKRADSFWDNEEKEGKWIKYGSKKRKHEKKDKKKTGKKGKKESKEGGEYRSSKGQESEKKDRKSVKKEEKNTSKSELSKKYIEIT